MLKNVASIQIQKVAKFNSIPKKSFRYYKKQSSIIFRRIRIQLVFNNILIKKKKNISLALDFRTFLENMKTSSSLSKILETGINVFKIKYQIIKIKKNIMKYRCYSKKNIVIDMQTAMKVIHQRQPRPNLGFCFTSPSQLYFLQPQAYTLERACFYLKF